MGITVLSTLSPNSSLAIPGTATGADAQAPGSDFAALFVEQLSASLAGILPTDNTTTSTAEIKALTGKEAKDQDKDLAATDIALIADPATLNPAPLAPVLEPQPIANFKPDQADGENLISELSNKLTNNSLLEDSGKALMKKDALALGAESNPGTLTNREQENTDKFSAMLNSLRSTGHSMSAPGQSNSAGQVTAGQYTPTEAANIAVEPSPTETPPQPNLSGIAESSQKQVRVHENPNANNLQIPASIHESQWAHGLGEKVVWLARNDQQTAQININPPQLGPMQISLNLNGDQATAVFASPHAEVRQAIEDAMPRLREMLSSAGISLGDANVGAQLPQQNRENAAQFANSPPNGGRFADENAILAGDSKVVNSSGTLPIQRGRGLVDLFA